MFYKNAFSYFFTILTISFWWLFAFKSPIANETHYTPTIEKKESPNRSTHSLLNLNRKEIKRALDGNYRLIKKLIAKWDLETEYLEQLGYNNLKRLSREDYVLSQLDLQLDDKNKTILIDGLGVPFDLNEDSDNLTFFPQTYCSAEILLSLVDFEKIVAIPANLSHQYHMQANPKIEKIQHKIDHFDSEKIYAIKPGIAIVADYSQPRTIESLKAQGTPLFLVKGVESFIDLRKMIKDLGYLSKEYYKSLQLNIFIEAAMHAIDNKRTIELTDFDYEKVLLIQLHKKHSLPQEKSLIHECVKRIGINKKIWRDKSLNNWQAQSIVFSEEDIISFNPKTLLIITDKQEKTLDYIYKMNYANYIDAAKNQSIHLIDEQIQRTTSQYIVLAYYDINHCLVKLHE